MADDAATQLDGLIRKRIKDKGGWLGFDEFMQLALHEPGLGYYSSGAARVGPDEDFITSPELGSLFAGCVAEFIRACGIEDKKILELGPGRGTLAAGILEALAKEDALPCYLLLETSPGLREQQQRMQEKNGLNCEWIDELPEQFSGIVIANELLDALPCKALVKRSGQWLERGVGIDDQGDFIWSDGQAASAEDHARLEEFPELGEGYCLEINSHAEALAATLADRLKNGVILFIDYGYPRRELYHVQRHNGTLRAHLKHTVSDHVLPAPGMRDITSHVDFTAIAEAAVGAGASVAGFATQAEFLLDLGIEEKAAKLVAEDDSSQLRIAKELQTLLHPSEMGEQIKVLALCRGGYKELLGFRLRGLAL